MKIEYKNIIGQRVEKDLPCHRCCFYSIHCVPYRTRCARNIFEEERTQIFKI